jgi:hypothetical protein
MMTSTDGTYSVINKAKSLAKKPSQRTIYSPHEDVIYTLRIVVGP